MGYGLCKTSTNSGREVAHFHVCRIFHANDYVSTNFSKKASGFCSSNIMLQLILTTPALHKKVSKLHEINNPVKQTRFL